MNFAFYDLETSGLSPAFDQPLQFAAVLTDGNLVELERFELRCRLAPHILPSPHALALTGVSPAELTDPDLPSYFEFAQQVAGLVKRWAPAVWTGYNSIGFDENMLRHMFYQNLLPEVYATQFNGNKRFDILTAAHAAYARDPGLLSWPTDELGRLSFKLESLAPANGFAEHNAHDALGDVLATVHVAGRVAEGNPALWAGLLGNTDKSGVKAKLEGFRPCELAGRFGGGEPQSITGCFCGYAGGNGTHAAFFDLGAADPSELLDADDDRIRDLVEGQPRLIRGLATNKAPALFEVADPDPEHLRRAAAIEGAPEFRRRVGAAIASRFPGDPDAAEEPVEKRIYGGFYSNPDKRLLEEFQQAGWPRRLEIAGEFGDRRLRQLGRRLVAFHCPETLSPGEAARFREHLREKWTAPDDSEPEWMTLGRAKAAIDDLRKGGPHDDSGLDAIADFLEARAAEALD